MKFFFSKLRTKIYRYSATLWSWVRYAICYPKILYYMIIDKRQGYKVIVYHLSSPGHTQYHLPTFTEIKSRKLPIKFYIAQDYPMQDKLGAFELPKSRFFPAQLAKFLPMIDVFIEGEVHGRGPKKAIKIFTGHGYPTKRAKWSEKDLRAFDYYFFYGPLERELFAEIQKQHPVNSKRIKGLNIGYPKLDSVLNGTYQKKEILEQLGLNINNPTILYAPAWDPGGAIRTHGLKIPEQILSIPNINLIVKLHPANLEPPESPNFEFYTGGCDWRKKFEKLRHHKNFRFIDNYSINPLLVASDLMITDFSGVALEFMTQNKPVLYIDCPEFYNQTLPKEGCDPDLAKHDDRFNGGRNAGKIIYDVAQLENEIIHTLAHPKENESKRLKMTERFLYHSGQGKNIEANQIIKFLNIA